MLVRSPTSSGRARRADGRRAPSVLPSPIHERRSATPRSLRDSRMESSQSSVLSSCSPEQLATLRLRQPSSISASSRPSGRLGSSVKWVIASSLAFLENGNRFQNRCHLGTQRRLESPDRAGRWAREALERSAGGGKDKVSVHRSHSLRASFRTLASGNRSEMGAVYRSTRWHARGSTFGGLGLADFLALRGCVQLRLRYSVPRRIPNQASAFANSGTVGIGCIDGRGP